jgi:hypothetical protein
MPGRNTFTATARGPLAVSTSARCTCAIEAAATGGPKLAKLALTGRPNEAAITASASCCGERRHLVLQMLEIARKRGTDHVGARRQKLTELDVARTEPRERHRQTRPGGVA